MNSKCAVTLERKRKMNRLLAESCVQFRRGSRTSSAVEDRPISPAGSLILTRIKFAGAKKSDGFLQESEMKLSQRRFYERPRVFLLRGSWPAIKVSSTCLGGVLLDVDTTIALLSPFESFRLLFRHVFAFIPNFTRFIWRNFLGFLFHLRFHWHVSAGKNFDGYRLE